ncbi:hypothetical protein ACFW1M_11790 [Streptomyces inhibens]|uniref:hypothetical protein n=1 Tax=Streptomyces inhibens TaxID=2293571 RepID=UPI00369757DC
MDFIRYRVTDADGTFLDEFSTNAPDIADESNRASRNSHAGSTPRLRRTSHAAGGDPAPSL